MLSQEDRNRLLTEYQEIRQQLDAKFKEHQLSVQDLSDEQQAILTQCDQIYQEEKAVSDKDQPEEEPQAIAKRAFIKAAHGFFSEMAESGNYFGISHIEGIADVYSLDTNLLSQRLEALKAITPIGTIVLELVKKNTSKCTTVNVLERLFRKVVNKFADKKILAEHYTKYEKIYQAKASESDDLDGLEELFRGDLERDFSKFSQSFPDIVKAAINDPNYAPNAEQAANKQEAKEERAVEQMQDKWSDWLKSTTNNLSDIEDTTLAKTLDIQLLSQERKKHLIAPDYAANFWEQTTLAVEQALQQMSQPLTLSDAVTEATKVLNSQVNDQITDDFIQKAVESGKQDLPSGLKKWLVTSIDEYNIEKKNFATAIRNWTKEAANAVAICENQLKGRDFKLDGKKLANNLQKEFSKTANNDTPAAAMGQQLIQALPQQPTMPFYTVDAAWTNALNQLQTDAYVQQLWEQYITPHLTAQSPEQTQTAFLNSLPKAEALGNALYDARFKAPKTSAPTQKQPLRAAFKAERTNGQQGFHFFVHVPLTYEKAQNHKGQTWQHALPSAKSQDYYIEVPNSLSYEIDKSSLKIERHTTTYDVKDGLFAATTGVTFYLHIRDTLERRVVDKGGNGKFNVLTLDSTTVGDIRSKLKQQGIQTDFLKTGLKMDLHGNEHGEVAKVTCDVTISGFPVRFQYYPDKQWPHNLKMSSAGLLAHRKASMMDTYGSQSYDIKFYAEIHSVRREGPQQEVSVINGRSGTVTQQGEGAVSGRADLEVTFISGEQYQIILKNND